MSIYSTNLLNKFTQQIYSTRTTSISIWNSILVSILVSILDNSEAQLTNQHGKANACRDIEGTNHKGANHYNVECQTEALLVKKRFLSPHWSCSGVETSASEETMNTHPYNSRDALVFDLQSKKTIQLIKFFTGKIKPDEGAPKPELLLTQLGLGIFYPSAPYAAISFTDMVPYSG